MTLELLFPTFEDLKCLDVYWTFGMDVLSKELVRSILRVGSLFVDTVPSPHSLYLGFELTSELFWIDVEAIRALDIAR